MTGRAARHDVVIQTGANWTADIQCYTPGPPVAVETVAPGQRIYVDGRPLLVATVTPRGTVRVALTFGEGLYSDPVVTFTVGALVAPAVPAVLTDAVAAYHVMDPDQPNVPIPSVLSGDGLTVTLTLDPVATAAMDVLGGAHSWDCYVRTDATDWQRVLEGTMAVIRGDAR